jgi:hypothetical protein
LSFAADVWAPVHQQFCVTVHNDLWGIQRSRATI